MIKRSMLSLALCTLAGMTLAADQLKNIDSKTLCQMFLAQGERTYLDPEIERELRIRPAPSPVCTLPSFMNLVLSGVVTVDSLFDQ
mgnify:CR=1 FL=1